MDIYLADLRASEASSSEMPLNIGNIAAFLKKHLPQLNLQLFTNPLELKKAIDNKPPKIFMTSNYCWNKNLSLCMAKYVKKRQTQSTCIMGGPNISLNASQRKNFLKKNPSVDFYVLFDAELAILKLVKSLLANDFDIGKIKSLPGEIESVAFINRDKYIECPAKSRLKSLDDIPSPYAIGIMDKFFATFQTPKIQSVRGCPYSCVYCNMGIPYYSKLIKMSLKRFSDDLDIIVDKMKTYRYEVKGINIIDDNFGLAPEDIHKARMLKSKHDKTGYPDRIDVYTAKNLTKGVIEAAKIIKDLTCINHTPQSLNPETLNAIKRPNKDIKKFIESGKWLTKQGFHVHTELISGLPLETKKSFIAGLNLLDNIGLSEYTIYQLTIIDGSPMDNLDYLNNYGIRLKYRAYPNSRIKIGNKIIEEYEKVVYRTSSMLPKDYFSIRLITFLLRLQVAMGVPDFFEYLKSRHGISSFDVANLVANKVLDANFKKEGNKALAFLRDFDNEAHSELLDSARVHNEVVKQRKNLVHKYRTLILLKEYSSLCDLYLCVLLDSKYIRSKMEREILSVFLEFIKLTDIRSLFMDEKLPSIQEVLQYKVFTHNIKDLSKLKDPVHRLTTLRKVGYIYPVEYKESILNFLSRNDEDSCINICNKYGWACFKLKMA